MIAGPLPRLLALLAALSASLAAQEEVVARLRGLEFSGPVEVEVVEAEELGRLVEAEFDRRMAPARVEAMSASLAAFGVVPRETPLRALLLDLWRGSLEGWYDRGAKKVWLVRGAGANVRLHELVHALDHQHHDVVALSAATEGDADAEMAVNALVEGTATDVMVRSLLGERLAASDDLSLGAISAYLSVRKWSDRADGDDARARRARAFLLDLNSAPYAEGLRFVRALRAAGGPAEVERAFETPPATTEQVLHPATWLRDRALPPPRVELADLAPALGEGFRLVETNRLGELALRQILAHRLPFSIRGPDAPTAAAGWEGDSYRVYEGPDRLALVWRTRWDRPEDAVEFETAWRRLQRAVAEGIVSTTRRAGQTVDVVEGVPASSWPAVRDALAQGE